MRIRGAWSGDAARALTESSSVSRSTGDRFETIDNGTALGIVLKLRGDFAGAASAYRLAAVDPTGFSLACWSLANLETFRFTEVEISLMQQRERTASEAEDRYHLCFAIGKAFEDSGRYEENMDPELRPGLAIVSELGLSEQELDYETIIAVRRNRSARPAPAAWSGSASSTTR